MLLRPNVAIGSLGSDMSEDGVWLTLFERGYTCFYLLIISLRLYLLLCSYPRNREGKTFHNLSIYLTSNNTTVPRCILGKNLSLQPYLLSYSHPLTRKRETSNNLFILLTSTNPPLRAVYPLVTLATTLRPQLDSDSSAQSHKPHK